jgi:hypothetical protein
MIKNENTKKKDSFDIDRIAGRFQFNKNDKINLIDLIDFHINLSLIISVLFFFTFSFINWQNINE